MLSHGLLEARLRLAQLSRPVRCQQQAEMQRYRRYYHLVVSQQALNHANTSICGAWANPTGSTTDCHLGQTNSVKQGNL
jgi:hypothetical protein